MSDITLSDLERIQEMVREVVQVALREQNETFQERVDEILVLKNELIQHNKEFFILGADAQKSNETKIAHLLTQFEEAVTSTFKEMNDASQKLEEMAESAGGYSGIAQKNLDRAGKWSIWFISFSAIIFAATIFYFNQVRMDTAAKLSEDRAVLTQIDQKLDSQKNVHKNEPVRKTKR